MKKSEQELINAFFETPMLVRLQQRGATIDEPIQYYAHNPSRHLVRTTQRVTLWHTIAVGVRLNGELRTIPLAEDERLLCDDPDNSALCHVRYPDMQSHWHSVPMKNCDKRGK